MRVEEEEVALIGDTVRANLCVIRRGRNGGYELIVAVLWLDSI
jgi:hypothetical protein